MKKTVIATLILALAGGAAVAQAHGGDRHGGKGMMRGMDADQDGRLTRQEFAQVQSERFKQLDADGNGQISPQELSARADQWFTKLDSDGDGALTREEIRAGHQAMRDQRGEAPKTE